MIKRLFYQLIFISIPGLVLFLLVSCITKAHAMDLEINSGRSYTKTAPNGVWRQEGFAYTQNKYASTQRIALTGVPFDRFSWLKAQVDYTNFGETNGNAQYVSDENYTGNPSSPCRSPCEALRSAEWKASANGWGFSALPTLTFNKYLDANVRVGAMFYHAENEITAKNFHDNYVYDPNHSVGHYDSTKNGFSWYYGVGLRVHPIKYLTLSVEYAHAPRIMTGNDGVARGTKRLMAGVIFSMGF